MRGMSMAKTKTTDEYERDQEREWRRFVAKVPIDFYGQRAYNVGDPVPVSAVEGDDAWISPEFVDDKGTAFVGSPTVVPAEPPTIDPTAVGAPPVSSPVDPTTITTTEG
jgi:hypothetical protein